MSFARSLALLCLLAAPLGAQHLGGPEEGAPEVGLRLSVEREGFVPGERLWVGATFTIEPGWHLYWRNPGDSGLPIEVTLEGLPPGFEVGPTEWPAPTRHEREGEAVDFVYEGEVTLLIPVEVPAEVAAGERLELRARASWLVCREACLPGTSEAERALVARADPPPAASEDRAAIAAARARLPGPLPEGEGAPRASWRGRELLLEAPGASRVSYFPFAPEDALPADPFRHVADGPRLRVPYPAAAAEAAAIEGVLVVERAGAAPAAYRIHLGPPPGAGEPDPNAPTRGEEPPQ